MSESIEIKGLEEVFSALDRLALKNVQMTPIMRQIGQFIQNASEESFEKQESPFGEAWKPNRIRTIHSSYKDSRGKQKSTHTMRGKQRKGFSRHVDGKKILIQESILANSFTVDANDNEASVGTNVVYAAIHQFGGKAGRGKKVNIPARPFMPVNSKGDMPSGLVDEILDYLGDKLLDE